VEKKGPDCCPAVESRKEALLRAASDLFLERGFDGTTLDAVIERTGGSRRTIYEYFGSKEGLLSAIVHNRCAAFKDTFCHIYNESLDTREKLIQIGLALAANVISEEGVKLYRLLVQECVRNPELGRLMYTVGIEPAKAVLVSFLKREHEEGRLRDIDAAAAADAFVGIIKGDAQTRVVLCDQPPPSPEATRIAVEHGVDIFLRGVLKPV
jgi:TetR/AcrR family transcriptional regulator, mexJK operon transcriptional repressor